MEHPQVINNKPDMFKEATFWYMSQVFCEAAEMLLRKDTGDIEKFCVDTNLRHEIYTWRTKYIDLHEKEKRAIEHLNEAIPAMYNVDPSKGMIADNECKFGAEHINDKIRRDAASLIRLYMRSRNAFPENQNPDAIERAIDIIPSPHRYAIFPEATIKSIKIN